MTEDTFHNWLEYFKMRIDYPCLRVEKIVQERLRHSSIQITLDTYSHVAPGLQEVAADRFDDVLITKPENG